MSHYKPLASCSTYSSSTRSLKPANSEVGPSNVFDGPLNGDKSPSNESIFPPTILAENTSPYFPQSFQGGKQSIREDLQTIQVDKSPFKQFPDDKSAFRGSQFSFQEDQSPFKRGQSSIQEDQSPFKRGQSSIQEDQSPFIRSQSSFPGEQLSFHEDEPSFQDDPSLFQKDQPSSQGDFNKDELNTEKSDQQRSDSHDEESPDRSSFLLSEELGNMALEMRDDVMSMLPSFQEQEEEDMSMITNAKILLRDAIEYTQKLDALKDQYAARLSQVSNLIRGQK